jgi:phosphatidylglycerophosphatase C
LGLWRLPFALIGFVMRKHDRGELKSAVIRMVMGGESRAVIDRCAEAFVAGLMPLRRFRPAGLAVLEAHRAAGDHLILLSASPDLYVPRIGRSLGFERTLCTEIRWQAERLDGALLTPNRRGAEKLRCLEWLRTQYPDLPVVAYGNSASDLDHMQHADKALLVNGSAAARSSAAQLGIPCADWA